MEMDDARKHAGRNGVGEMTHENSGLQLLENALPQSVLRF